MKRKIIIFFFILNNIAFGQGNLKMEKIPQKASMYCWAACIEMIAKYHGKNVNQCDCADQYLQILKKHGGETWKPGILDTCKKASCDINNFSPEWNQSLGSDDNTQYFDNVFSKNGFYSTEDTTPLSWESISRQIRNCKPFIMLVSENNISVDPNFNHAVIVKGYWHCKDPNNPSKLLRYLSIVDPLFPCEGESYSLRYDSLGTNFIKPVRYIHNIVPKENEYYCSRCDELNTNFNFQLSNDEKAIQDYVNTPNHGDMELVLENSISSNRLYSIKINQIDYKKLENLNSSQNKLNFVLQPDVVSELIDVENNIIKTFQKSNINTGWDFFKVSKNYYKENIETQLPNTAGRRNPRGVSQNIIKIVLSNKNKDEKYTKYEIVKFDYLLKKYYKFDYLNKSYLLEFSNPQKTEKFLPKTEGIVLNELKKEIEKYPKHPKQVQID